MDLDREETVWDLPEFSKVYAFVLHYQPEEQPESFDPEIQCHPGPQRWVIFFFCHPVGRDGRTPGPHSEWATDALC